MNPANARAPSRTLHARYVFPVAGEPIADGLVTIVGHRIVAVGRRADFGPVEDLGNVAILPGLVNAHTHLDLGDLERPLGEPGIGFVDWIGLVMQHRRTRLAGDSVERGLRESVAAGTTALGEVALPGWPVRAMAGAPLDLTVFLELIGPTPERAAAAVALAEQHLGNLMKRHSCHLGLCPHAPYSVHPELLSAAVSLSAARRVPLALHLAESPEEMQLLRSSSGPLRQRLEELGAWNAEPVRLGTRPLDYLRSLAAAHRALVVHGNYLDDEELAFLADRRERMTLVYCPRTHAHFRHHRYPLDEALAAGVTVALGTDSRASSPDLSLLAELRAVARGFAGLDPAAILRLGTINGARALGRDRELGTLEPGKQADLAVVALPDRDAADPHELLFDSRLPVVATWHRGTRVA